MRGYWMVMGMIAMSMAGHGLARAQAEGNQSKKNLLLTGKLIYVGDMPEGLDRWLIEDLRGWGKYTPTRDAEGADLAFKVYKPEKETQYDLNHGVPEPKKESRKEKRQKTLIDSIGIVDWVTGESLWHADVIGGKVSEADSAVAGPRTQIDGRGMNSVELALKITNVLHRYVDQLAKQKGGEDKSQ